MSAILKALKKLETESPDEVDIRSLPIVRRTATSARHRVKDNRFVYWGIAILSMVMILAGSIWFVFERGARDISSIPIAVADKKTPPPAITQKKEDERRPEPLMKAVTTPPSAEREPAEKTIELTTETEMKPAKSVAVLEKKTALPDSSRKDPVIAHAAKQPEQTAPEIVASVPAKSAPMESLPPPAVETETQPEKPPVRPDDNAPVQASGQNNVFSRSYVEGYEQSEPGDPFAAIPVKTEDDSGLKLQAIAWSENPKDRMAVINNSIVREGGSVGGAAITHIGEDMVVFKKEREEWKQLFRLR